MFGRTAIEARNRRHAAEAEPQVNPVEVPEEKKHEEPDPQKVKSAERYRRLIMSKQEREKLAFQEKQKQAFKHLQHVESILKGNGQFIIDCYRTCVKEGHENVVYSPLSVSMALAMVYAGAKNETASQIKKSLKFDTADNDVTLHLAFGDVLTSLKNAKSMGSVTMHLANRIYLHEAYRAQAEFLGLLQRHYSATVPSVDFIVDVERIRHQINRWVEEKTGGEMKEYLPHGGLDHLSRMCLMTAGVFKSHWARKWSLLDMNFHREKNKEKAIEVKAMQQQGRFRYGTNGQMKCFAVEIPLSGGRLSLVLLVPKDIKGLDHLETKMSATNLENIFKNLKSKEINITMPRFVIDSNLELIDNLMKMGITDLFHKKKADLTGIGNHIEDKDNRLCATAFNHKVRMEVNEDGTEVVGEVPVVKNSSCICSTNSVKQVLVDRPFMFLVRDILCGVIVFMGRVSKPHYITK